MANINRVDLAYFDSFADELLGRFQRLRHLVKDNAASGDYHEEILSVVLRNFLTRRYSVKTGFIYKDKYNISNQMDIIVVDENSPVAYIFQEGDFAIVMPEAVVAVAEVKTTLNSTQLNIALNNITSAKRLIESDRQYPGFIFGYQSHRGKYKMSDKRLDSWFKTPAIIKTSKDDSENEYGPDVVTWLKDNYTVLRYNPTTKTIGDSQHYHSFQGIDERVGWQLSMFLAIIVGACEDGEFKRTRMPNSGQASRLLSIQAVNASDVQFKIGEGQIL